MSARFFMVEQGIEKKSTKESYGDRLQFAIRDDDASDAVDVVIVDWFLWGDYYYYYFGDILILGRISECL